MLDEQKPSDILKQLGEETGVKLPAKTVTKSAAKVDESVSTIDDKVRGWQRTINHWRVVITQNERIIGVFCFIVGIMYSYSINECTRGIDFAWYVYFLFIALFVTLSALLIAEDELPFVVIVKFVASFTVGHFIMMFIIAVDGHSWMLISEKVCRYPATSDLAMGAVIGAFGGYLFKAFEEIRASKKGES